MAVLQIGSSGPEVTRLQEALVGQGYYVGNVDGQYGPKTAAAVAYLQSTHGLDIDGVSGPQVEEILDIGGAVSVGVHATWPQIDVWNAGDDVVVQVEALGGDFSEVQVRVVMWFRSPAGEDHTEETVTAREGSVEMVRLQIPSSIASTEGEVYYTGYVFDMYGNALSDEGSGSFRIDLPDRL